MADPGEPFRLDPTGPFLALPDRAVCPAVVETATDTEPRPTPPVPPPDPTT